jgi:APA family basic amino acid/polyamine antiporter
LVGLTSWLGTVTAIGFGAYTFSEYLGILFPYLNNYLTSLATGTLIVLWAFHQLGVKSAGKSQEWLSGIKALALLIFIFICFAYGEGAGFQSNTTVQTSQSGIFAALLSIFYAFDGWHTAAYFTEENKDPVKSMPKSMYIGVITVACIYLLINAGIMYVLPLEQLKGSKLAASDAIQYIMGPMVGKWVTIFLMLSIFGILNTQVMFAPRVIYSMSRDQLFFKAASKVNSGGTPTFATHITVFFACFFLLVGQSVSDSLSDIATFFFVTSYLAGFASLIGLRTKEPDLKRPYKVIAYPILPWFMVLISGAFLIGTLLQNLQNLGYLFGFLVVAFLLYRFLLPQKADN